jgi:hypothetical protein
MKIYIFFDSEGNTINEFDCYVDALKFKRCNVDLLMLTSYKEAV